MNVIAACIDSDTRCALELDELRYKEWANFHIAYVRKAAELDWRIKMRRKLALELNMSLALEAERCGPSA